MTLSQRIDLKKLYYLATIIIAIITISAFLGYPTIKSWIGGSSNEEFTPKFDIAFSNIMFSSNQHGEMAPNYESYLPVSFEIDTQHPSKISLSLIDVIYDEEIKEHLTKSENIPEQLGYAIIMENYSFTVENQYVNITKNVPVKITNLWIDPYDLAWGTRFNIAQIKVKIEVLDRTNNKKSAKEIEVDVLWDDK